MNTASPVAEDDLDLLNDTDAGDPPIDVIVDDAPSGDGAAVDAPITEPEVDPGTAALRSQLAAETKRREDAERLAARHGEDVQKAKGEVVDQQRQLILNSIDVVKNKGDRLEKDYADAISAGDAPAAAKIQREMIRTEAELHNMESARLSVEAQRAAPKADPAEGRVQAPTDPVENLVARLSPQSAAWVRQHPECATDEVLFQEMVAADARARRSGYVPDTPEYFRFVEQRLGFTDATPDPAPVAAPVQVRRQATPAAPVSRDAPSLSGAPTLGRQSVRLTTAEQEQARYDGLSNEEYGRMKLEIQNEKARMN